MATTTTAGAGGEPLPTTERKEGGQRRSGADREQMGGDEPTLGSHFKDILERKLLELEPPTPPRDDLAAEALPRDLIEALDQERNEYRARMLRGIDELSLEDGVVRVVPTPAAEPDWVGGSLLAFREDVFCWSGEIVHFDPMTGEIFIGTSDYVQLATLKQADRWCLKPFDFSEAITGASQAYGRGHAVLAEALNRVQGVFGTSDEPLRGSEADRRIAVWNSRWGLLWGPPGTGKTQTVAELLAETVVCTPERRILVIAPTNRAVDELTHRVCRILKEKDALFDGKQCLIFRGGVGAGKELSQQFPETLRDEAHHRQIIEACDALEREIAQMEARDAPSMDVATRKKAVVALRRLLRDETTFVVDQGRARVILLTVHRALRLVAELKGQVAFSKVVFDEGGMIPRGAAALIAPLGETVVLAGDPKQIGPVSRAGEGAPSSVRRWLRMSPLSHLRDAAIAADCPNVHLLRTQRRMHPAIAEIVGRFAYAGCLQNSPDLAATRGGPSQVPIYPNDRAGWIVLDHCTGEPRKLCHGRPRIGKGYTRSFSAELAITVAVPAIGSGLSVLVATPYRAQAQMIRRLADEQELDRNRLVVSTIHRQQGTEYDVVILDLVAAGRPFQPSDLAAMLNVSASRAKQHLFVLASQAEADTGIPSDFLSLFPRLKTHPDDLGFASIPRQEQEVRGVFQQPDNLGGEISNIRSVRPIFTEEQVRLFERQFGEGHQLVRGVAGSGKTYVLANWAARHLDEHPNDHVLVTYFNKALRPLVERLVYDALKQRLGVDRSQDVRGRLTIQNIDALHDIDRDQYGAVFVDEAQDIEPAKLRRLYQAAVPVADARGTLLRRCYLFLDDSQNVYGKQPLEEIKDALDPSVSFQGRSRVMKEAHRSTRQILDLAFNVVLDPRDLHGVANPGMKEFMRSNELVRESLLRRPEQELDGLYHVEYTERSGVAPIVFAEPSEEAEMDRVAGEIRRLVDDEHLRLGDLLVVTPYGPARVAEVLGNRGLSALAYGGRHGEDVSNFPIGQVDHLRVTTVFSCKGHESPVVFFVRVHDLDGIDRVLNERRGRAPASPSRGAFAGGNARKVEQSKRACFYVGATRAMVRQYITGLRDGRFVQAAVGYAKVLAG